MGRRATTALIRAALIRAGLALCLTATAACSASVSPAEPSTAVPGASAAGTGRETPSPAPSSPAPSSPAQGHSFTVVATGDVLLHPALWDQARADGRSGGLDFAPMLAGVKPYVAGADLAICHLETPLAKPTGPFRGYPDFSGPPQIATALKQTGYDACSTASNHTLDQGAAGIGRTLTTLDAAGIAHAGSARNPAEARRITILRPRGVQVALLSYTYGFNGHSYPSGQSWRAARINPGQIVRDARRARAAGAQVVILAMHWGTEYQQTPSAQQRAVAPALARSGVIDLIISHHAHVVEPIQRIGKVWVVYGLGNLIARHATPGEANQEGLLTRFTFTQAPGGRWTATRAGYLPLLVTRAAPIRVLPVTAALREREYGSSTRSRLIMAQSRTSRVVDSLGAAGQGLSRIG